jgi:hypothetical protein
MTEQRWNDLQGQMEGLGRAIAALAAELHEVAAIGIGDYATRLKSEADRLDTSDPKLMKAHEVMQKMAKLSVALSG